MTFSVIPRISSPRLTLKPANIEKILNLHFNNINTVAPTFAADSGLVKTVATAKAIISGIYVEITANEPRTLTASQTNWLYLQLTRDVNNEVSGAQLTHLTNPTEPTAPTDSVLLAKITTDATTITATDITVTWKNTNKQALIKHRFEDHTQLIITSPQADDVIKRNVGNTDWINAPAPSTALYFPSSILTAGEALAINDCVFISANNQVKKTLGGDADRKKCVGVMVAAKTNGASVLSSELLIYGVQDVVLGGAANAGDNLIMDTVTAGRVLAENSITPTFTGTAFGTHIHTFTGTALPTHQHIAIKAGAATTESGSPHPVLAADTETRWRQDASNALAFATISDGGGVLNNPPKTDSVTAGTPAGTNSAVSVGTPAGTISAVEHGRVIGKLINGGIAGDTRKALICLAG